VICAANISFLDDGVIPFQSQRSAVTSDSPELTCKSRACVLYVKLRSH
jgi:hypothetical protein